MNEAAARVIAKMEARAAEGDRRYGSRWEGWELKRFLVENDPKNGN